MLRAFPTGMKACGLLVVDKLLRVLTADRFFLEAIGSRGEPEGHSLSEVLGPARGRDPVKGISDPQKRNGSIETTRFRGERLKVSYARTKLENDESAIFVTVETMPPRR